MGLSNNGLDNIMVENRKHFQEGDGEEGNDFHLLFVIQVSVELITCKACLLNIFPEESKRKFLNSPFLSKPFLFSYLSMLSLQLWIKSLQDRTSVTYYC